MAEATYNTTPLMTGWEQCNQIVTCSKCNIPELHCICRSLSVTCHKCNEKDLDCMCDEIWPFPKLEDELFESEVSSPSDGSNSPHFYCEKDDAGDCQCFHLSEKKVELGAEKKKGVARQLFADNDEDITRMKEIETEEILLGEPLMTADNIRSISAKIATPFIMKYAVRVKSLEIVLPLETKKVRTNLRLLRFGSSSKEVVRISSLTSDYWLGTHITDCIKIKSGIISPNFEGEIFIDVLNNTTQELNLKCGMRFATLSVEQCLLSEMCATLV